MEPYQLPLGRNVLWTGTMNQDETTKSLSDKVLDRSIIIHFPRPTKLKRRRKLSRYEERGAAPAQEARGRRGWSRDSDFTDEEVTPSRSSLKT